MCQRHNILKGVFTTFLKKIKHLLAAQAPQGLKRCADAQLSKIVLFAAQAPQGLKRYADAQHSKRVLLAAQSSMTKEYVVPEAQHSKRAYSQLFLTKRSQAFTT